MLSGRAILLLACCIAASCEDLLLTPCDVNDTECVRQSLQSFFLKTANGVPQYDIKPIDPLVIPSLEIQVDEIHDVWDNFNEINVVGLKNQEVSKFSINKDTKAVQLQAKVELVISGNLSVEAKKKKISYPGTFSMKASAIETVDYSYDFKTDEKNVAHIEVGPETISCQVLNILEMKINPELMNALISDVNLKKEIEYWGSNKDSIEKKVVCSIIDKVYVDVVHNIRAAVKLTKV